MASLKQSTQLGFLFPAPGVSNIKPVGQILSAGVFAMAAAAKELTLLPWGFNSTGINFFAVGAHSGNSSLHEKPCNPDLAQSFEFDPPAFSEQHLVWSTIPF